MAFEDLYRNPMFHLGAGLLAQPQNIGQGVMTGMGSYQQYMGQNLQQQILRERMAQIQAQRQQEAMRQAAQQEFVRQMASREQFAEGPPVPGMGAAGFPTETVVDEQARQRLENLAQVYPGITEQLVAQQVLPPTPPKPPTGMRYGPEGRLEAIPGYLEMRKEIAAAGKPEVTVQTGAPYKLPSGFMFEDPQDPGKGVVPIPGGPAARQAPEKAAKTQMLRTAKNQLNRVKELVYDKKGNPNWTNITNAWMNTPRTKGRELATAMEFGIQAITRAETGAAMPPEEVRNTRRRFQPFPGDTDETIEIKMKMFDDFIEGSLKLIDPTGNFDEGGFVRELNAREQGDKSPANLSDEELLKALGL